MDSRRRHRSGPPSPLLRGINHDDIHPSDRGFAFLHDGRYSSQPGPTSPHTAVDTHRRQGVPVDQVEHSRGRRPTRQAAYPDPSVSVHDAGARSTAFGYDPLPRARPPLRSHSQGHPYTHHRDGPRGRPPPCRHSGGPRGSTSSSRSKSASSASLNEKRNENASTPWWQNPVLRTCAVTALSTGLCAALESRGDPGQWKGAKGLKVAVATVGSAVVDGFLGQKHPDGLRHKVMKTGVEVAIDEAEKKKQQVKDAVVEEKGHDSESRRLGRHHSTRHGDGRRHRSYREGHRRRH